MAINILGRVKELKVQDSNIGFINKQQFSLAYSLNWPLVLVG
jgi:hypothetical protein